MKKQIINCSTKQTEIVDMTDDEIAVAMAVQPEPVEPATSTEDRLNSLQALVDDIINRGVAAVKRDMEGV